MGSKCPHMGRCAIQTDNPYSTTHDNKMLINTYDRILTLQGPKPSRHKKAAGRQDTCDTYVRALNVSPPPQQTIITRLMFRECRSCRYCRKVVHISGASMLVQAVSITRCALPFRDRRSCRHCRSAETYTRQMLVQRYNNSNNTFAVSGRPKLSTWSKRSQSSHAHTYTGSKIPRPLSRNAFLLPLHDNGSCRLGRSAVT